MVKSILNLWGLLGGNTKEKPSGDSGKKYHDTLLQFLDKGIVHLETIHTLLLEKNSRETFKWATFTGAVHSFARDYSKLTEFDVGFRSLSQNNAGIKTMYLNIKDEVGRSGLYEALNDTTNAGKKALSENSRTALAAKVGLAINELSRIKKSVLSSASAMMASQAAK